MNKGFENILILCDAKYNQEFVMIKLFIKIREFLAATTHKAPTIRPPASHHENYKS